MIRKGPGGMSSVCFTNNISNLNITSAINNPFDLTETDKIYSTVHNINHNTVILLDCTWSFVFIPPFSYSKSFQVFVHLSLISVLLSSTICFVMLCCPHSLAVCGSIIPPTNHKSVVAFVVRIQIFT